jgi:hypothetical protein
MDRMGQKKWGYGEKSMGLIWKYMEYFMKCATNMFYLGLSDIWDDI